MYYTIEMLVTGSREIVDYYGAAERRWGEIMARPEARDVVALARMLTSEQDWFERNCGGQYIGQEIMVVAGMGRLYSTGYGFDDKADQARRLHDAFQQSYCSLEVKSIAREVAQMYGLLEEKVA